MSTSSVAEVPVSTGDPLYVYGIVPAETDIGDVDEGLGMGSELRLVVDGPIGALVEAVDVERPLGRRRDLVAHSSVLNSLVVHGPVLPVRFGSVVAGEEAVVGDLLRPNQEHFVGLLDSVHGKVQFNLRARYVLDTVLAEIVAEEPEVAELRRRTAGLPEEATHRDRVRLGELVARAVDVRRQDDSRRIVEAITPHAEDFTLREDSGMDALAEISLLVSQDRQGELERAAEVLAEEMDGRARLSLAGPMALFDFVPEQ